MIVVDKGPLIRNLLEKGHYVSVERGVIRIDPPIPDDEYKANYESMASEIVNTCGVNGFAYRGYTTGRYGKHKYPGVNLQFINLRGNGSSAFAIFNVELDRARRGKNGGPGTPLPEGQFRVSVNHGFYRFWVIAGIDLPPRLSSFHDYMGKLQFRIFAGAYARSGKEKLQNKTVVPLEHSHDEIAYKFGLWHPRNCHTVDVQHTVNGHSTSRQFPDDVQIDCRQHPDSFRTSMPDKDIAQNKEWRGSAANFTMGEIHRGYPSQGNEIHMEKRIYGGKESCMEGLKQEYERFMATDYLDDVGADPY